MTNLRRMTDTQELRYLLERRMGLCREGAALYIAVLKPAGVRVRGLRGKLAKAVARRCTNFLHSPE